MSVGETSVPATVFGAEEELWRQRVGALTVVPALFRQLGTDPAPVLAAVDLDPSALEFAENTIPYATFGRLMEEGARRTRCEHLGLLAGQAWHLSTMGLVGQLVRHSSTVRDGLRLGVVYHHLNSQGGVVFLRERGAVAEFGYAIYCRGIQGANQIHDGVLAASSITCGNCAARVGCRRRSSWRMRRQPMRARIVACSGPLFDSIPN